MEWRVPSKLFLDQNYLLHELLKRTCDFTCNALLLFCHLRRETKTAINHFSLPVFIYLIDESSWVMITLPEASFAIFWGLAAFFLPLEAAQVKSNSQKQCTILLSK